ncbi:hypothetical protein IV500_18430 [Paeniglutamicibacter antarcticus]|uniref:Uncharacterized protein n=1 Tax=Arthrobacter terrae TaxID=2935737 RepID=A0A931CUT3_9MICC|nr:hypothetical protein [Arthrobacter terrae]MBG0741346.1 hypothetical protein [Arthrobacter terrae]
MRPRTLGLFLPRGQLPGLIGNVLVCRDGKHLTRTYLKTLTPVVPRAFFAFTGWEDGK